MSTSMTWLHEDLEHVPCDLCGSRQHETRLIRPDGLKVVECIICGLAFVNPRPRQELVQRLYTKDYFQKERSTPIGYADYRSQEHAQEQMKTPLERLRALAPYWRPTRKRCLEVGCATGTFCHLLKQQGATTVVGADASEYAIQQANRQYPQVQFMQGELANLPRRKYHAVFAFELIQHLLSPCQFFREAAQLSEPEALLAISTPNYDCGRRVGLRHWAGCKMSFEHLYYFNADTLTRCARLAGWRRIDAFSDRDPGIIFSTEIEPVKHRVRQVLEKTKLLSVIRFTRSVWRKTQPMYRRDLDGHNLLMCFRRIAEQPAAAFCIDQDLVPASI